MPIKLTHVDGIPVEGPELDEEALRMREKLTERVLAEYETNGAAAAQKVCEAVRVFEAYAKEHVIQD